MLRNINYVNKILKELESNPTPLLKVGINISAQWLIGRFVRVAHFKSDLTNVANFVRFIPNLKLSPRQFELCGGGSKTVWG